MFSRQEQMFCLEHTCNIEHSCLSQAMEEVADCCEPVLMESEDPLFIMYTSGTTGEPTGIVHTQAGYLLYAAMTHKVKAVATLPLDKYTIL